MLLEKLNPEDPPGLCSQALAWGMRLELVWEHLYFRVENISVSCQSHDAVQEKLLIKNKKARNKSYLELLLSSGMGKRTCFVLSILFVLFHRKFNPSFTQGFRCQIFPATCCEMLVIPWKYFLSHMVYHQAFVIFHSLTDKTEFVWVQCDSLPHLTDKICFCPLWPT